MEGAHIVPCFCFQVPAIAPCSSELAARLSVSFFLFLYLVHNLPQLCMHMVVFSLLEFVCILLIEEMFVQVQALFIAAKGPRSQPVSKGLSQHLIHACNVMLICL